MLVKILEGCSLNTGNSYGRGTIANIDDFTAKSLIKSGIAVKCEEKNKAVEVIHTKEDYYKMLDEAGIKYDKRYGIKRLKELWDGIK